ncbi:putative repeat protein (TIGR01451 family) [Chryseobacterium sp. H1D6B]|uniref:DUF7619 domain-containing protein n=1 Tax=Chryseobacterium sp. H1D6B TaxID=2940588 RepID=UPI0015CBE776|nr:T9SS type A sorting domain-containing protein [Chryseobacterium sp. H1D6B]MDH6252839.1 putative repeat protein (TIGR01451 family) [Chryseobacterium sp. H1D6B]
MKKIYLIILMIIFSVFRAQIVNIPDPNFKAKLLAADVTNSIASTAFNNNIKIDTNNNGEIEVSEALQVGMLRLYGGGISNITGIAAFTNLESLEISSNNVTSIDLNSNVNLGQLSLDGNTQLNSVNLTNCTQLNRFFCSVTAITSLNLQNKPLLKNVYIQNTPLTSLNISNCPIIYELSVVNTQLTALNASNLQNVFNFSVQNNPLLSSIDFTNSNMEIIQIRNNNLSAIAIQNQSALRVLDCGLNHLTSLTTTGCPQMVTLLCDKNSLTELNLSNYPLLYRLDCSNNSINTLNLSQNPALEDLKCGNNGMAFLNLKNGKVQQPGMTFINNNPNLVVCCDENELAAIQNMVSSNNTVYNNYAVTSYCSFTPGGTFYTAQGNTKYDLNNNGCDINDPAKAFQKFMITSGSTSGSVIANISGNYSIPLQAGTHTITPFLENPSYFTISPSNLTANFPAQASPLTQNFCLSANGNHNDLEIVIIPVTPASPGFDAKYKIIYKNKGTTVQSGTLVYNFNNSLMNYLSATTAPNSQAPGILTWNFTNLLPFETKEITVTFKLNTPTQTPPLHGGDVLHYTALINGSLDETPADNIAALNQTVVNSFDPNDKTCLEGTSITQAQVGDYVHYLIRFENTGTANAKNIVVKDEIDTSKFDLSSLAALSGSHNFTTRITSPNVVEFIFENILLPFDDANNDGYVSFKIKTKSSLAIGNSFNNTAKIYFDYNAPILTNTYTTTVQQTLAVNEISVSKENITVYPNPVTDILFIQSKNEIIKAEIYDTAGRIITSTGVQGNSIKVSELTKGNYMIKLFTNDNVVVQKFIKN